MSAYRPVSVSAPRRFCTFLLLLGLGAGFAWGKQPGVTIEWDPDYSPKKVAAIWLGYLMARTAYRLEHHLAAPASGRIVPTFDEEVYARDTAATVYSELREKDKELNDRYWNDLLTVQKNKFIPQYVWTYLRQPSWPEKVKPANLEAFRNWSKQKLRNHKAETHGALSVTNG